MTAPPLTAVPAAELSALHLATEAPRPELPPAVVASVASLGQREHMEPAPGLQEPVSAASWARAAIAQDDHLQAGVLANGIPALPADLSLDTPALGPKMPAAQPQRQPVHINSGIAPPPPPGLGFAMPQQRGQGQVTGFPAPSFGGLIWSQAPGTGGNLWQPPPPPPPQQQQNVQQPPAFVPQMAPPPSQHNLPTPSQLEAFYGAANQQQGQAYSAAGPGASFAAGPQQTAPGSLGPQFGNFSSAYHQSQQPSGQFSHFGAFVPTGKQPDWSVPPNPLQTQSSGMGGHTTGQGYPIGSRSGTGLDSIWQSTDASGRFLPPASSPGLNGPIIAGAGRSAQHLGQVCVYITTYKSLSSLCRRRFVLSHPLVHAMNMLNACVQGIDIGFLPSIGPTIPQAGSSSGGLLQPQGIMPSGLPETLLGGGDDPGGAAMRQRLPNGNVRREGSMRGQRGRGGMQAQGVPHRGRGAPRGAARCAVTRHAP